MQNGKGRVRIGTSRFLRHNPTSFSWIFRSVTNRGLLPNIDWIARSTFRYRPRYPCRHRVGNNIWWYCCQAIDSWYSFLYFYQSWIPFHIHSLPDLHFEYGNSVHTNSAVESCWSDDQSTWNMTNSCFLSWDTWTTCRSFCIGNMVDTAFRSFFST